MCERRLFAASKRTSRNETPLIISDSGPKMASQRRPGSHQATKPRTRPLLLKVLARPRRNVRSKNKITWLWCIQLAALTGATRIRYRNSKQIAAKQLKRWRIAITSMPGMYNIPLPLTSAIPNQTSRRTKSTLRLPAVRERKCYSANHVRSGQWIN